MSVNKIYPEEPCGLAVTFPSNPFSAYNKDYADIEEIMMCLKKHPSDSDDAYLRLYWKDGSGIGAESGDVLLDEPTHTFTMMKKETDVLETNNVGYNIYIGVKLNGLSKMIWLRVNDKNKIIVEPDGIAQ